MIDTNYISSIVKVLETPNSTFFNNTIPVTKFRVQLPQIKNTQIVNLIFWGNLAKNVANYYQINDYIMIEGYLSLNKNYLLNRIKRNSKKVEITVLKVYSFPTNSIYKN
jgi:single-stranded DNA-binding protein